MVMSVRPGLRPSDSPSVRPSVRPGLRPPVFHTFFQHALTYWAEILHMTLFYYTTDQVRVSSICVKFCWSCPPFGTQNTGNTQFLHFSLTCFDILSWNFSYDFLLVYYRSSLSVVNLRQFWGELCPFWNLEYWKYTVFHTFLQHAMTYWADILHMTLFYCTSDQVRVSSICVNFCWSYAPFGT